MTFADLGQTIAENFGVGPLACGLSFLSAADMITIREELERRERDALVPQAARSAETRGRLRPEPEDDIRPAFQRDRDRIIHCKAFRRLKHKTQVFFAPTGDHYRTRLTHTLEVTQIARTIARALRAQRGSDRGHRPRPRPRPHAVRPPGRARARRSSMPGGFEHYEQSLRVVDVLERDGAGLNLTWEVRDGILKHSKGKRGSPDRRRRPAQASTLEGQVVRISDLIAYVNHDIDDAIRAGVLRGRRPAGRPVGRPRRDPLHPHRARWSRTSC